MASQLKLDPATLIRSNGTRTAGQAPVSWVTSTPYPSQCMQPTLDKCRSGRPCMPDMLRRWRVQLLKKSNRKDRVEEWHNSRRQDRIHEYCATGENALERCAEVGNTWQDNLHDQMANGRTPVCKTTLVSDYPDQGSSACQW